LSALPETPAQRVLHSQALVQLLLLLPLLLPLQVSQVAPVA